MEKLWHTHSSEVVVFLYFCRWYCDWWHNISNWFQGNYFRYLRAIQMMMRLIQWVTWHPIFISKYATFIYPARYDVDNLELWPQMANDCFFFYHFVPLILYSESLHRTRAQARNAKEDQVSSRQILVTIFTLMCKAFAFCLMDLICDLCTMEIEIIINIQVKTWRILWLATKRVIS